VKHGSVAISVMFVGIYNDRFVEKLVMSLAVK